MYHKLVIRITNTNKILCHFFSKICDLDIEIDKFIEIERKHRHLPFLIRSKKYFDKVYFLVLNIIAFRVNNVFKLTKYNVQLATTLISILYTPQLYRTGVSEEGFWHETLNTWISIASDDFEKTILDSCSTIKH